ARWFVGLSGRRHGVRGPRTLIGGVRVRRDDPPRGAAPQPLLPLVVLRGYVLGRIELLGLPGAKPEEQAQAAAAGVPADEAGRVLDEWAGVRRRRIQRAAAGARGAATLDVQRHSAGVQQLGLR
ncbi:hypothetical protein T484DRAFT_1880482, partial [Baffinella frigidus]